MDGRKPNLDRYDDDPEELDEMYWDGEWEDVYDDMLLDEELDEDTPLWDRIEISRE